MRLQRLLFIVDEVSTWCGKAFAWLIMLLTVVVCVEVVKRYLMNAPTAWMFDVQIMIYGTLFMMGGAYTLAQNGHVRGDFLYGSMRPRVQASLDLALYLLFFVPGIAALIYAGWTFAEASWLIGEHVNTADGPVVYPFKLVIPLAGALVLMQGAAEMVRCLVCLRTGVWPARLKDAAEIDMVGEQLADSKYIDEEARQLAMRRVHEIDEAARHRGVVEDDRPEVQR